MGQPPGNGPVSNKCPLRCSQGLQVQFCSRLTSGYSPKFHTRPLNPKATSTSPVAETADAKVSLILNTCIQYPQETQSSPLTSMNSSRLVNAMRKTESRAITCWRNRQKQTLAFIIAAHTTNDYSMAILLCNASLIVSAKSTQVLQTEFSFEFPPYLSRLNFHGGEMPHNPSTAKTHHSPKTSILWPS